MNPYDHRTVIELEYQHRDGDEQYEQPTKLNGRYRIVIDPSKKHDDGCVLTEIPGVDALGKTVWKASPHIGTVQIPFYGFGCEFGAKMLTRIFDRNWNSDRIVDGIRYIDLGKFDQDGNPL